MPGARRCRPWHRGGLAVRGSAGCSAPSLPSRRQGWSGSPAARRVCEILAPHLLQEPGEGTGPAWLAQAFLGLRGPFPAQLLLGSGRRRLPALLAA